MSKASLREAERFKELRSALPFGIFRIGLPLYLIFSIADYIYLPELHWQFLVIRLLMIPIAVGVWLLIPLARTSFTIQALSLVYIGCCALGITCMVAIQGEVSSPYYAGLNIAILFASIFPTTTALFISSVVVIYTPFFFVALRNIQTDTELRLLCVQSFFMFATTAAMYAARHFNEKLRLSELDLREKLREEAVRRQEAENAVRTLSAQVAHDIRSPLSTLNTFLAEKEIRAHSDTDLVLSAVSRIRDITNDLLSSSRSSVGDAVSGSDASNAASDKTRELVLVALATLIERIVTEKRLQYRPRLKLEIHFRVSVHTYGLFVSVEPSELQRVISNVIDNAVESIQGEGRVIVDLLSSDQRHAIVAVSDTGVGIDPNLLPKLTKRGVTFNKPSGLGLGLFHAKEAVQSWGGDIKIESSLGSGTTVLLQLPRVASPAWFPAEICVDRETAVVVLDDDLSIHQLWKRRLELIDVREVISLSDLDQFREWWAGIAPANRSAVFLIDFQFHEGKPNGLDLVSEFAIENRAILVTSHTGIDVQRRCAAKGIKLLPKDMISFIPIVSRSRG